MLDSESAAPEEGGAGQAPHYTPKEPAEPLTARLPNPNVKRFNRKMLSIIAVTGGTVIALAFTVGLQPPKKKQAETVSTSARPPTPNEHVNALPTSYSAGIPELGVPQPGDAGATTTASATSAETALGSQVAQSHQLTLFEQYAEQTRIERLRNAERARTASVSFANAGANNAPAESENSGTPSMQNIQDRLLSLAERSGQPPPAPAGNTSYPDRDDQNRQEGKGAFADKHRESDFDLHAMVQKPRSPYTLFAGTILPCVLTQGINSDLPGQIGCLISQNVYDTVTGSHLLLPQGTKAIGTYDSRVSYGQERVLVVWTRLLRPDGSTLSLEGMPGTDLSGYAGLTGNVNNHYLRLLSGVVLGSVIGASAQIGVGANSQNPSFAALAMQGAGQNINEAGQQITRKNLNIQPTIEVPPGSRLNIFATKDLILPPYTK